MGTQNCFIILGLTNSYEELSVEKPQQRLIGK